MNSYSKKLKQFVYRQMLENVTWNFINQIRFHRFPEQPVKDTTFRSCSVNNFSKEFTNDGSNDF